MVNNLFRSTIALTIAIYTLGHTIDIVNGNDLCTLEGMRQHAADACEVLMRHIRSADDGQSDLSYHIVDLNDINSVSENESQLPHSHGKHHRHHHLHHDTSRVHIKKQEFPNDGYLLVDQHLSKYLVRKNLDTFAYNTVNGKSEDNNDDGIVISLMEYDNRAHQKHHLSKHRARQHPRFRRQQDKANVEFCCRYPENDICSISMC